MKPENQKSTLEKSLGPWALWGLGVGYVISGMYFGWNLGLAEGGTLGMAIALCLVIVLYITFVFTYAELACAIPKAGGAFDYALAAFGKNAAFIAGLAQIIEFVFAPPAVAYAIGSYFHIFLPQCPVLLIAIVVYFIFTLINITGIRVAARLELIITIIAVIELLIFAGITLPSFEIKNLAINSLPNGYSGIFASLPFAIWFFLAIEGVANVAEETINPQKNIIIGFGSSLATLIFLSILTFVASVGVSGWENVVYNPHTGMTTDSPLPIVLSKVIGEGHIMYHLLVTIGLFGLVASFHGLILASGRSTFEFGRYKYFPAFTGKLNQRFHTPVNALLFNMVIGIFLLFTGKLSEIIILSCLGALTMYIISAAAQLKLRKIAPGMARPFKVPFHPFFPLIACGLSTVCFFALVYHFPQQAAIYLSIIILAYLLFHFYSKRHIL